MAHLIERFVTCRKYQRRGVWAMTNLRCRLRKGRSLALAVLSTVDVF